MFAEDKVIQDVQCMQNVMYNGRIEQWLQTFLDVQIPGEKKEGREEGEKERERKGEGWREERGRKEGRKII